MFERAYIEITDICNLSCSFCPKTSRPAAFMSVEDFRLIAGKLRAYTDCFCLHVMGEPLLHPGLDAILAVCDSLGARVILTTNGTLLGEKGGTLLSHPAVYKIQISLHSFEANDCKDDAYFDRCFDFARRSSERGIITVLRLWNRDGRVSGRSGMNDGLLARMKEYFDGFWAENKRGFCIRKKLYLEYDEAFVWPEKKGAILSSRGTCRALSSQIAVLCDGTVVPCCMDREGDIPLGNIKEEDLSSILDCVTAKSMLEGFGRGEYRAPLCMTCGYADRFNRKKNGDA